ncbi:succinate dehydrogenase/fumarate reductase iron-sulfur subunit [Desulfosporosinus acididurans]|uniref:Succinate dehydrogenase/fumarate reductase iron-sulfur subunit n=1 Tax=Desulfosporosinus acididurans TaxID=476652 RepID=A0A0J1IRJ8_9FIRM|nr:(Fe-S)-binding protein [Desulfosporosinus acididurans]KLU67306.1 succinate dehydrogenase/fumarate reductase iron-sulfur subunit [Desulfosporosinus acididurans]
MIDHKNLRPKDMGRSDEQLVRVNPRQLMPLLPPYDQPGMEPPLTDPKPAWREKFCTSLDGYVGIDTLTRPKTKEEEDKFVQTFLNGLEKSFSDGNNGALQPFLLSFEYCAKCDTCSSACHIYEASGKNELYRPIFRSEVLRKIVKKYFTKSGKLLGGFVGADIDVNWETIARLGELAYRCNLCRRCAQTCPLGLDNSILTKEIRKIFSQEMGIAPLPLHTKGTVLQLKTGSSTGITKPAFLDTIEFMEEDIEEKYGYKIKFPIDKKGADILLIHNAGEYMAWPENPIAFAILFEEAGIDWTLSSEIAGYDNVNYGIWYDDFQAKKLALLQMKVAKELGVNRIVIAECGHAHKASMIVGDRMTYGDDKIPVESCLPLLWNMVKDKRLKLDPSRNNFPVTLHDPCNYVRGMGIVEPQRNVLKEICPQFREMTPHGVNNYCCGGGGGFAITNSVNFSEWRNKVSSRMKFNQILGAFQDTMANSNQPKYVCAPCSNCKGAIRDILEFYEATAKFNVQYGGLVELMVNALVSMKKPFMEFLEE